MMRVKAFFINPPSTLNEKQHRYYFGNIISFALGVVVHIVILVLLWLFDVLPLVIFNIFSLAAYVLGIIYIRRGRFNVAYALFFVEFPIHQALCVYLIGWASGMQYWLLAMSVGVVFLSENKRIRMPLSVLLTLEFILLDLAFRNAVPVYAIDPNYIQAFYYYTVVSSFGFILFSLFYFESLVERFEVSLEKEHQKSEGLLQNILPVPIARRLKEDTKNLADKFEHTSILFADIAGFTPMSQNISPEDVVAFLNSIFSKFDELIDKYRLEKIKTIGDAYMVAAGIPEPCTDHAELIAELALDMSSAVSGMYDIGGNPLQMRIGINSGPVIAGVIGKKKFIYDLWGDAVNTASRMESHGIPGEIQVTESTYDLLKGKYEFTSRGKVKIKGKGDIATYLLKGRVAVGIA